MLVKVALSPRIGGKCAHTHSHTPARHTEKQAHIQRAPSHMHITETRLVLTNTKAHIRYELVLYYYARGKCGVHAF